MKTLPESSQLPNNKPFLMQDMILSLQEKNRKLRRLFSHVFSLIKIFTEKCQDIKQEITSKQHFQYSHLLRLSSKISFLRKTVKKQRTEDLQSRFVKEETPHSGRKPQEKLRDREIAARLQALQYKLRKVGLFLQKLDTVEEKQSLVLNELTWQKILMHNRKSVDHLLQSNMFTFQEYQESAEDGTKKSLRIEPFEIFAHKKVSSVSLNDFEIVEHQLLNQTAHKPREELVQICENVNQFDSPEFLQGDFFGTREDSNKKTIPKEEMQWKITFGKGFSPNPFTKQLQEKYGQKESGNKLFSQTIQEKNHGARNGEQNCFFNDQTRFENMILEQMKRELLDKERELQLVVDENKFLKLRNEVFQEKLLKIQESMVSQKASAEIRLKNEMIENLK